MSTITTKNGVEEGPRVKQERTDMAVRYNRCLTGPGPQTGGMSLIGSKHRAGAERGAAVRIRRNLSSRISAWETPGYLHQVLSSWFYVLVTILITSTTPTSIPSCIYSCVSTQRHLLGTSATQGISVLNSLHTPLLTPPLYLPIQFLPLLPHPVHHLLHPFPRFTLPLNPHIFPHFTHQVHDRK